MGGRERLLRRLGTLAQDAAAPPMVMVTHHVEEIPIAFTHVLLVRSGRVVVSGLLHQVLSGAALSQCFDLPLALHSRDGRWTSQAVGPV
jgi:iron complex transport system ATP-binding protein